MMLCQVCVLRLLSAWAAFKVPSLAPPGSLAGTGVGCGFAP